MGGEGEWSQTSGFENGIPNSTEGLAGPSLEIGLFTIIFWKKFVFFVCCELIITFIFLSQEFFILCLLCTEYKKTFYVILEFVVYINFEITFKMTHKVGNEI